MSGFLRFLAENRAEMLALTQEYFFIVLLATALAVAAGLPLGILLTRVRQLRAPVLGFANVMQTVPSLALFGLLIPIPFIGGIGARTAVIALALYALLPVIRNTVTGILGIDPKIREAATAMGMTDGQVLRKIELPLAAPVILTGVRVSVVISVGVATIAAAVGAGGLGTYIFRGLRQNDNDLLIAGALAAALLALLCDLALGQIESSFRIGEGDLKMRRRAVGFGIAALLAGVMVVGSFTDNGSGYFGFLSQADTSAETPDGNQRIVIGSKDFTESVILAEILAQMLENDDIKVERQFELGGNLPHDALLANQIDVYPEYTGTAYTAILKHSPITDPEAVYQQIKTEYAEKFGFILSPPLGFANDFAILVRGETARRIKLKTISDVIPLAREWQAGFGQDFMSREDGYAGFTKAYGLELAKQPREMELALTYRALASGDLDIIVGNSTDGLIKELDLFRLKDDRQYFPPYQAVYVTRAEKASLLKKAFARMNNSISTEEMQQMNYEVDGKNRTPKEVAAEWLLKNFGGRQR